MEKPPMDIGGIVYIVENAQQFWSELEDFLRIPDGLTLNRLDATMRRFVSFCAAYHEQYLQSPLQLEHACDLLLASELFQFHSERMSELLTDDAQASTDPHIQLIIYNVLVSYGRRNPSFLRSQKRWQPLIPLLIDNVTVDADPDADDSYLGSASGTSSGIPRTIAVPIEAKLRTLSVRVLYEVCRVQKMSLQDLRIFDDKFINYLFDLVEETRHMQDETFNYSTIKLIVALNEQFMVASLAENKSPISAHREPKKPEGENRIIRVLMSRLDSSMTFGENMIFMLNRADRTPEDLCMQLLVLKLLYLLFTTKGMSEYFYTNDLCVLVDVFLREIGNIDEDNESLRHTYLRVLHPLLTKTQLRSMPYKRAQIVRVLELLVENESIRDVDPTTKRLVTRCLSGEWCVQFRKSNLGPVRQDSGSDDFGRRVNSPGLSVSSAPLSSAQAAPPHLERPGSVRGKHAKASRSAENLLIVGSSKPRGTLQQPKGRSGHMEGLRQSSNDSATSLPRVAAATANTSSGGRRRDRTGSVDVEATTSTFASLSTHERRHHVLPDTVALTQEPVDSGTTPQICIVSPTSPGDLPDSPVSGLSSSSSSALHTKSTTTHRRMAPAPPPKRRKPPAVPVRTAGGTTLTTLSASSPQPSLTSFSASRR
ncbi:hypothetical protein AcW1_002717 [Taiwanofungus camphoratus]|nr:hypothetical protein AcW1_002717 [Antrodia cinnamomea]